MPNHDTDTEMEEYLAENDPYQEREPLNFDIRRYAVFVKENNLRSSDITPEILNMFAINPNI